MSELQYPVGMSSFPELIQKGYVYVDKTQYIEPLLKNGKFKFLSRPRRFGKSLLLSTLKAYFEGRRDLFKGLAADTMDLDWTPTPVLRFDLNSENFSEEDGLHKLLNRLLEEYEKQYEMTDIADSLAGRFSRLIKFAVESTGRQVVILIDEYDKPLLDIEDNKELFEKNQRILKSFFGNLKSMDDFIHFAFITGVSRFSKVSIFSDINNLNDITMVNDYADICGWSEEELLRYFRSGIKVLAEEREEDFEDTLKEMRVYYDGYLFALKGSRLYNPYSVLKALTNKEIAPYWFDSGTPAFLARRVKAKGTYPADINGKMCSKKDLTAVGIDDANPLPLMFQTGYLTLASYDREMQACVLRFPNHEVEIGFYENLLKVYVPDTMDPESPFNFLLFKKDIVEGCPRDFMKRLATMLKALPYEDIKEPTYRAVTFLISVLSGTQALAEHHSYKGRSDLEVFTSRNIYIFEFKYNKTLQEAMDQIHDRDYAGQYAMDSRKLWLIGANFVEDKHRRGLEYELKTIS